MQLLKANARAAYEMLAWREELPLGSNQWQPALISWRSAQEDLQQKIIDTLMYTRDSLGFSNVYYAEETTFKDKIEAVKTCTNLQDFAKDVDLYCNMVEKADNQYSSFKKSKQSAPIEYLQTSNFLLQKITDDLWESGSKNVKFTRSGKEWIATIDKETISTELSLTSTNLQDLPSLTWRDDKLKHEYLNYIAPCYAIVTINDNDRNPTLLRWKWTNLEHGYSNIKDITDRYIEFLLKTNRREDNEDAKNAFIAYKKANQFALLNKKVYKKNNKPVQQITSAYYGWDTRVLQEDENGNVLEDFYELRNHNLFAETGWTCENPRIENVKLRVYPLT